MQLSTKDAISKNIKKIISMRLNAIIIALKRSLLCLIANTFANTFAFTFNIFKIVN